MASRSLATMEDMAEAIRQLDNELSKLRTELMDLHQRRIVNAAPSIGLNDYVVRMELNDGLKALQDQLIDISISGIPNPLITRDILPISGHKYILGDQLHSWRLADIDLIRGCSILGGTSIQMSGPLLIFSNNTGQTSISVTEANGTTGVNTVEFKTFGGTIFWKVICGQDAGAPGTMVTRDHVPFTDNTFAIGNTTHRWGVAYLNTVICNTLMSLTGAAVIAPSGAAGVSFSGSVTALTVSGGIITGHTP